MLLPEAASRTRGRDVMDHKEQSEQARAESVSLGLLAKSLFRPSAQYASELRDGVVQANLRGLLGEWPDGDVQAALDALDAFGRELQELDLDAARLTLEVDYNRLFVGPGTLLAPPYESFYATVGVQPDGRGQVRGLPEREVSAEYAAHGLGMPEAFVEFPDHIAVELEYLALLAAQEADAWEAGDAELATSLQADQERFREDHLGTWLHEFARRVAEGAQTAFYRSVASLVERTAL